jgi:hypothetical protein
MNKRAQQLPAIKSLETESYILDWWLELEIILLYRSIPNGSFSGFPGTYLESLSKIVRDQIKAAGEQTVNTHD